MGKFDCICTSTRPVSCVYTQFNWLRILLSCIPGAKKECIMEWNTPFSKKRKSSRKSYKETRIHVLLVESFVLRNRESTCTTCLAGCHNDYEMFRHRVNLQITHTVEWCFWPGAVLLDKRNVVCYHEVPEGWFTCPNNLSTLIHKNTLWMTSLIHKTIYIFVYANSILSYRYKDLHQFWFFSLHHFDSPRYIIHIK